jgi:hypothetical protein
LSAINKENASTAISRNNNLDQILYPKPNERDLIEPSAKFSIERLKQLADQRLSPSNIENSGLANNNKIFSIDHSAKFQNIIPTTQSGMPTTIEINHAFQANQPQIPSHHLTILSHHHHQHHHHHHANHLKYGLMPTIGNGVVSGLVLNNNNNNNSNSNSGSNNNNNNNEVDIERIKLARTLSNGKELSDFGFRIQLGGLTTNYAHSETHSDSEELNVDGNEDSSQDENSVSN